MKITYQIHNLDSLEQMHLDADVRLAILDYMLEARRSITRLENSRILNSKLLPKNMSLMIEGMKGQKEQTMQNIEKMFSLKLNKPVEGLTILELYITPDYFLLGELLNAQFGRIGRKLIKVVSQQGIIDNLEEVIRDVYTAKFEGDVLEDDGKKLLVTR